ncbi:Lsr2 family protein [Dermatophilaceae bacterium Soc4.6]
MARTVIEQISDDLDGSTNASAVTFSYDGTEYTIDLSSKNKTAFDKVMKPYIAAGTKVTGRRATPRKGVRSTTAKRNDLSAIREWATANGYEVSARGRVKAEIIDAYTAAH